MSTNKKSGKRSTKKGAAHKRAAAANTTAIPVSATETPEETTSPEYGLMPELLTKLTTEGITLPNGQTVIACTLRSDHLDWLDVAASREGRSKGNFLDRLVRIARQHDPHRNTQSSETSFSGPAGAMKIPTS